MSNDKLSTTPASGETTKAVDDLADNAEVPPPDPEEAGRAAQQHKAEQALKKLGGKFVFVTPLGILMLLPAKDSDFYRRIPEAAFRRRFNNPKFPADKGDPVSVANVFLNAEHPIRPTYDEIGLWPPGEEPEDALNLFMGLEKTQIVNETR